MGLTNLPRSYANCLEIWTPQTSETLRASNRSAQGLLYLYLNCLSKHTSKRFEIVYYLYNTNGLIMKHEYIFNFLCFDTYTNFITIT